MRDEAFERFHSWHKGWVDGAASRVKNPKFNLPKQTPKRLQEEYELGFQEGRSVSTVSRAKKMMELGYNPKPLRETK